MTKIVVNRCFGGFGLSIEAEDLYMKKLGGQLFRYTRDGDYGSNDYVKANDANDAKDDWSIITFTVDHGSNMLYDYNKEQGYWYYNNIERDDPILVETVEELGEKANGRFSRLEVVEIPDDVQWEIDEYDGQESVHEVHQSW